MDIRKNFFLCRSSLHIATVMCQWIAQHPRVKSVLLWSYHETLVLPNEFYKDRIGHFQKYHKTLCLSLQNFAQVLLLFSLGAIVSPRRKWKQCLCKNLEGKTKTIMVFLKVAYWNSFITYPKWTLTNAKKYILVILKTYLRYPFYILTLTSFQVWLQLVCHRKRPLVLSRCPGSFLLPRSYSLFSQSDHPASFVAVLKNNKCFTTVKWKQGK